MMFRQDRPRAETGGRYHDPYGGTGAGPAAAADQAGPGAGAGGAAAGDVGGAGRVHRDWAGAPRDYFLTAARNVLDFFQARRDLYRACLRSGADTETHMLENQAAEDLCRLLAQPRFQASAPDADPRIVARFYTGAMLSLLRWWLDSDDPVPVECLIAHLEHFIPAF